MDWLPSADTYVVRQAGAGTARELTEPLDVRLAAAWGLGRLGDARAIRPLVGLLYQRDDKLRTAAADALVRITGRNSGAEPALWNIWLADCQRADPPLPPGAR